MKEFIFTWRIENIPFSWHLTGESVSSPSFTAGPIQNSVWTLQLYPRGYKNPNYLSLFLWRRNDDGPTNLSINFDACCISDENSPLHSGKFSENEKSFTKNGSSFGFPRFMLHSKVFNVRCALYLPGHALTLRCRMWKDDGTVNEYGHGFGRTKLSIERILSTKILNYKISERSVVNIHSGRPNTSQISLTFVICEGCTRLVIKQTNVVNIKYSVLRLAFIDSTTRKCLYYETWTWFGGPEKDCYRLPLVFTAPDTGNKDSVESSVQLYIDFIYSTGEESKYLGNKAPYSPRLSELLTKYKTVCVRNGNLSDSLKISRKLWNLYEEKVLCDVELKTKTTSFFVHKFVLCARSPVFSKMLTSDMKEKETERIEISDIGDDILSKFLLFLYTDAFEDLEWEAITDLYYAADKYRVDRLKFLCSSYFLKNINYQNFRELLTLAKTHHDSDLKRTVEDFILQKDKKILRSSSRKQFVKEQTSQSAETRNLRHDKEKGKENSAEAYGEKLSVLPNVQGDFAAAYKAGIVSDIAIKTTGATLRAHRSILSASSSTLREKLTNDSKDKPTDILDMADLEPDIVSRMLHFVYSGGLGQPQWDTTTKLYHAADVYQMQLLKTTCSYFLLQNLTTSNAGELLLLADEHKDAVFKEAVEFYIFVHDEEVFRSDEWADFSRSNSLLANETMRLRYTKDLNSFLQ